MVASTSGDAYGSEQRELALTASVASSENKGSRAHILQYEQLLSIQQDQHALAMERKDAEVAHLKVRLAALEGHLAPQDAVATAVQTKDEECALMMAAKHKELELLAALLQMREQQIEDLQSQCEESQLQLASCRASPGSATPLPGSHTAGRLDAADGQTRREVHRLRLRMEELEASITEQQDRCILLAKELQIKSERVEVLENEIQSLKTLRCQDGSAFHREPSDEGATQDASLNGDIRGAPTSQSRAMSLQESFRQSNSPGQEACSPSRYFEEDTYPSSPQDTGFEQQAAAPPSTGKQSQELLREMRRLRQQMEQMAELEKLAAGRDPGFPTDKLGAMSSLSVSSGSRPSVSNNAQGPGQWSPMADRSGPSARRVFRPHALSESHLGSTPFPAQDGILSAWEYRPHEDDPVDAAVARLVNRGRYRAWRALLCRLEHGVYLCGTKRVHIRVDEEQGLLEASKDGGRTWADLREIVT